jgi:glucan phosphoethanolaminetransferase (alkaline phosphatase superfamily)
MLARSIADHRGRICLILALLLLCAPYAALALWLLRTGSLHSLAAYLAAVLIQMVLCAALTRSWRGFLLLQVPILILCAAIAAYTLSFGILPGRMVAYVLLTTNWEEVRGFFTIWQGARLLIVAIAYFSLYFAASWGAPRSAPLRAGFTPLRWIVLACAVALAAFGALDGAALIDGLAASPVIGTGFFIAGPVIDVRRVTSGSGFVRVPYRAQPVAQRELHIFVLGESSRRDSWSVYGYARPTTPYLSQHRDELIVFTHAMADANTTVFAVPMLLTGMHPDVFDAAAVHGSIVDLAREAGYRTAWLMNQDVGISLMVGIKADRMVYPPSLHSTAAGDLPFDGTLLKPLRDELARGDRPQFIGLHLIGSHWPYQMRYPPAFASYAPTAGLSFLSAFTGMTDERVVNAYDNSVSYTDWLLGQIIDMARQLEVPATLTFVSDHGEDIYALDGRAGHGTATFSRHQYEIPAFIWMNEAFRRAHPDKLAALRQNSDRLVRSHNVFYALADLMGIAWPGSRPQESFASSQYAPDASTPYYIGAALGEAGH